MMTVKKTRFVISVALGAALIGASMLSACGKLGDLEKAPPIMNRKAVKDAPIIQSFNTTFPSGSVRNISVNKRVIIQNTVIKLSK